MYLAPIPDSHIESPMKSVAPFRPDRAQQWRHHRRTFGALYSDPRIVDQIGGKIYRYPRFVRLVILLGLSLSLWFFLFYVSSALLSAL